MTSDDDGRLRFKPRARIIRAIGDQLISGPEAAVIELVKNAYDADATRVEIVFTPPLRVGEGRITVTDDGHGMRLTDILDKWMEPATATKAADRRSLSGRRIMMGSKGIGRFAAAKLGIRMVLRSISEIDGKRDEFIVGEIDWSQFTGDAYLSDIAIDFLSQPTNEATGTEIEIRGLNESWSKDRMERLLLELRRLISPIEAAASEDEFKIFLDLSACTAHAAGFDGAALVNGAADAPQGSAPFEVTPFPLVTSCDYEVSGSFNAAGVFSGEMQVRRAGQAPVPIELLLPVLEDEEDCGPVGVKFFIFDREAEALKQNMIDAGLGAMSVTDARRILDNVAGIAVYRDGFRVRPYGDLENDWLTLDRERVQDPSMRLGHNQIAGYVTVEGQGAGNLVERSSREGFEDNGAYRRLQRLLKTLLAQAVEPRRRVFREDSGLTKRRATSFQEVQELAGLKRVRQLIGSMPEAEQAAAYRVVDQESQALSQRISVLEDRQRVLEAKSSLGNIIGEVLHEGTPPAGYIATTSVRLQRMWHDVVSGGTRAETARGEFPGKLHLMKENAERLSALFELLRPLSGGKRGVPKFFRPIDPISGARDLYSTQGIPIYIHNGPAVPEVVGYPEDLSTAMVNLIGNAIYWLEQSATADPQVDIRLSWTKTEVLIEVEDNGPGVPSEFASRMFDVGFTLKPGGTGLGLNIAREALGRSEAKLGYDPGYEDGSRFVIIYDRGVRAP